MRFNATALLIALPLLMVVSSATADSQVFRCVDDDGSVVFSDQPCDDEGQAYEPSGNMSVVATPDNLEARIQANQEFVENRRERLREAQERSRQRQEAEAAAAQAAPLAPSGQNVTLPFWPAGWSEPPPPAAEGERRATRPRDERFSALGGRQLGSARRSEDDGEENDD